ncbi:hypothetical protein [Tellurirhabdus bombi]|uniref:hypothetical protein n=1 Tax=Tellurirhabdus bombi TaxID=2907205 RepID=UPI001F383005|nr:hypothetical protein [Tellurirhabdus bombi]
MNIVIAKLIISLLCVFLVSLVLYKRTGITAWLKNKSAAGVLVGAWVLFRLVPFLGLYVVAGYQPTSDIEGFWEESSKAFAGQIVYRDFWSPYSPLYAYFLGLWLNFWYSSKMIVLTMAIMDGVALALTYEFFKGKATKQELLFKALLYLLLPGSLVFCVVGGQEDVWMWLFIALAFLVYKRKGVIAYSIVIALGVLTTKAIFGLVLVPLFLLEKEKIRFLIPLTLIGAVSILILYPLVGLEFLQPLGESSTLRAPNVLSVLNAWTFNAIGVKEKIWTWMGLLFTVGAATTAALRMRQLDSSVMLSHLWVVLYGLMMIVQPSAYSNYLFLFLLPLVFQVVDWSSRRQIVLLFVFNVLAVVHPSYWWRLGLPKYLVPSDIVASTALAIDYGMQLTIVVVTSYFIWLAFPKKTKKKVPQSVVPYISHWDMDEASKQAISH